MSMWHRLFKFLLPSHIGDMEKESRKWMVQCPLCEFEQSIWDLGGIRYKAYSKGKRILRRCRQCGKIKWHRVYYKEAEQAKQEQKA
jgi:hypothetical protein